MDKFYVKMNGVASDILSTFCIKLVKNNSPVGCISPSAGLNYYWDCKSKIHLVACNQDYIP
jgi:hypothetical protein